MTQTEGRVPKVQKTLIEGTNLKVWGVILVTNLIYCWSFILTTSFRLWHLIFFVWEMQERGILCLSFIWYSACLPWQLWLLHDVQSLSVFVVFSYIQHNLQVVTPATFVRACCSLPYYSILRCWCVCNQMCVLLQKLHVCFVVDSPGCVMWWLLKIAMEIALWFV